MKTVVITGSTRGIGFGLAQALLERGCNVVISGRRRETAEQAAAALAEHAQRERILAHPCDVTNHAQVQALWDAAVQRFGRVDIWINNAGQSNVLTPFWQLDPQQMRSVVETNVLGCMYGCAVAARGMLAQGSGAIYNLEGYGSKPGRMQPGMTLYGTTKAAMAYLDQSLAKELEGKPVLLGSISPGMVVTDMLLDQQRHGSPADWERAKQAFNMLADTVETVAPWIADQVLANTKNGARFAWLNGGKAMWRVMTARFTKRKVME